MIVCDARRVLFVHVQKTGGSTIDLVLREVLPDSYPVLGLRGGRHATWSAAAQVRPELGEYFTFGFVRNPWARLYSWYLMVERRGRAARRPENMRASRAIARNPFYRGVLEHHPSFASFVIEGPERFRRLRIPQLAYLERRGATADYVGRTESFEPDLAEVLDRLGLGRHAPVPRANATRDLDPLAYRAAYTPEMRDIVGQNFARDIEAFGYDF